MKSEMQHQFWITKKTVQRKLGSREDEHIISSDADLDAKIEVFKSISETSTELGKIIEQFQERICFLSQEESVFGKFLKDAGKRSRTTGPSIINTGKSVTYCGQQRMCVRVPLLRLQHEVDIFRNRAVIDTQATIAAMEKERTEYRAAMEWMKSSSAELDPDTGRGIDKFRTAQSHVRVAKQNFDILSMNCIQKIDLLAAARCNMFSHGLVSYVLELREFAQKTNNAYKAILQALEQRPKYDFCVLKDLKQPDDEGTVLESETDTILDQDQSLFFASDYVDDAAPQTQANDYDDVAQNECLIEFTSNEQFMDSLLQANEPEEGGVSSYQSQSKAQPNATFPKALDNSMLLSVQDAVQNKAVTNNLSFGKSESAPNKSAKQNSWIELFAELDPFSNPEAFDLQLTSGHKNFQQT